MLIEVVNGIGVKQVFVHALFVVKTIHRKHQYNSKQSIRNHIKSDSLNPV